MRRLGLASAILAIAFLGTLTSGGLPTSATSLSDGQRATAALDYLLSKQWPNGSIDGSLGETADFVIGAAAAGYDPSTLAGCSVGTGALTFLAATSDAGPAPTDPAQTGKAILAVVAAGMDPAAFFGRNLLGRLNGLYESTTGKFGDGSTFGQSFAILAMVASGQTVPPAALAELRSLQDPDASWSYGHAPVGAGQGDTNSTAIALMALNQAGDRSTNASALAYLATQQMTADGGFPYQNPSAWGPAVSDPDSDALVAQALVAAGENPAGASWTKGSSTVLTHLRTTQGADGGYGYPGSPENAFTTVQVPAALIGLPYGSPTAWTPKQGLPGTLCPVPSPSPSAVSSAIAGSSASAGASSTATLAPSATPTRAPTPRPTVVATARPAVTVAPLPESSGAGASATGGADVLPSPTISARPVGAATATPAASAVVAGRTAPSSPGEGGDSPGGPPLIIWYALASGAALLLVAGIGWIYIYRPVKR